MGNSKWLIEKAATAEKALKLKTAEYIAVVDELELVQKELNRTLDTVKHLHTMIEAAFKEALADLQMMSPTEIDKRWLESDTKASLPKPDDVAGSGMEGSG